SSRRHTRFSRDWSSDVCSSDLQAAAARAVQLRLEAAEPNVIMGNPLPVAGDVEREARHTNTAPVLPCPRASSKGPRGSADAEIKIGRASCRETGTARGAGPARQ